MTIPSLVHCIGSLAHWLIGSLARYPTRDLDWFFDCLDRVKPCPHEGCRNLNDDHRWSREAIATWLEAVNGADEPVV